MNTRVHTIRGAAPYEPRFSHSSNCIGQSPQFRPAKNIKQSANESDHTERELKTARPAGRGTHGMGWLAAPLRQTVSYLSQLARQEKPSLTINVEAGAINPNCDLAFPRVKACDLKGNLLEFQQKCRMLLSR